MSSEAVSVTEAGAPRMQIPSPEVIQSRSRTEASAGMQN